MGYNFEPLSQEQFYSPKQSGKDSLQRLKTHSVFLILLACAAALFLSDIWKYKEFVRAESYFAMGARLMVEQNEWLAPHAPDEFQLNKPPLTYWLIGICYKLFGASYGAARLPSALSALLTLIIVYLLGSWLDGKCAGLVSAAMLATSYIFLSFARMAMSDMLLTFCVACSLACFTIALCEETRFSRRLAVIGYFPLALGILTKGPVALVLVSLPLAIELVITRRRGDLKRLRLPIGLLLLILIAAPYFLLLYSRAGIGPLLFFFVGENFQRFTGAIYQFGARPFWYEFVAFFGDFAPWSLLLPLAIWFDWRKQERDEKERRATRILYLWLACTVLLFSLSSFKRDYYLLPAMPAAALIIGRMLANADKLRTWSRHTIRAFLFLPSRAALALASIIWAIMLTMQWTLMPILANYLPAARLAASVPADAVIYTSSDAAEWASDMAFNLAPQSKVERLDGDLNGSRLQAVLQENSRAVALVREREYLMLRERGAQLKVLAEGETFGHGGLSWNRLRNVKRDRLLLIIKD